MVRLHRVLVRRGESPEEVAKKGVALYEKFRPVVELPENKGKIIAIATGREKYFIVDTSDIDVAVETGHKRFPSENLFFYRIGVGSTTTISQWDLGPCQR